MTEYEDHKVLSALQAKLYWRCFYNPDRGMDVALNAISYLDVIEFSITTLNISIKSLKIGSKACLINLKAHGSEKENRSRL